MEHSTKWVNVMAAQHSEQTNGRLANEVDLCGLKRFAREKLPVGSSLREILLANDDKISVATFLAYVPIWLQLLKFEGRR